MAFGLETYRSDGSIPLNGSNAAGVLVDKLVVKYYDYNVGSKIYTDIPAGALFLFTGGSGRQVFTVGDDGAGNAQVSWAPSNLGYDSAPDDSFAYVMAKNINDSGYGLSLSNDVGDLILNSVYPIPQFVETAQPPGEVTYTQSLLPGGGYMTRHTITLNQRQTSNRMTLVYLPDSTDSDTWYSLSGSLNRASNGGDSGTYYVLYVFRKQGATSYVVPTLHVFALDGPVAGGGSFGIQCFSPSGGLLYDSSVENMTVNKASQVSFTTTAQSMPIGSVTSGVLIPWIYKLVRTPTEVSEYQAAVQRKGSTIYYKMYKISSTPVTNGTDYIYQEGTSSNFTFVVDITKLNPATVAGVML